MKKILNEWKRFVAEAEEQEVNYGNEEFERRFVDAFSRSIQDRAFIKKIKEAGYNLEGIEDKTSGQLQAGISHTWLTIFELEGARFVIQYLQKFFGKIFGELNSYKATRADVKYNKRPVAFLGDYQLMDWWIADDGIDMFYAILKNSMEA